MAGFSFEEDLSDYGGGAAVEHGGQGGAVHVEELRFSEGLGRRGDWDGCAHGSDSATGQWSFFC